MNHYSRPICSSATTIALLGSLGALLMSACALLTALQFQSQRLVGFSPWQMLKFLSTITTPLQALEMGAWGVITGVLMASSSNHVPVNRSRALAALAGGALVPIGLALLGHTLNTIWPDTTGPTDAPLMTLLLALYSLGIPWLLGRLIIRIPGGRALTATST